MTFNAAALLLLIAGLALIGWLAGRARSNLLAGRAGSKLHSRPQYHGWYVALVALWAITGLPMAVIFGIGFGGLLGFLAWLAINAIVFAASA